MIPSLTAPIFTQNPRDSDRSPIFANWRPLVSDIGDGSTGMQFDFLDGVGFEFVNSVNFDFLG